MNQFLSECKHCSGTTTCVLRLFKNHMKKTDIDPKWLPHIYTRCVTCGRKQGNPLPQTEELRLELDGMALMRIDFDEIKDERIGDIQKQKFLTKEIYNKFGGGADK